MSTPSLFFPRRHSLVLAVIVASAAIGAQSASAQEAPKRGASAALLEEVVVTARKRAEVAQEVPMSVTAFGSSQIDALKVRDLTSLSVGMPNVALDDVGTTRGTANFSIRGLGINSSIPSIDPTVGVFVDGVYIGMNNGLIFDTFDLQSIEVLRGPQGILFGRNVTGGAILMNTKRPGDELEAKVRTAFDVGPRGSYNSYLMGSVGGPISDNLGAKITAYYNDDRGFAENEFDGQDIGAIEQQMVRPVIAWQPSDSTELVLRYEYSKIEGDGPVAQNHTNGDGVPGAFANFDRDSHKVSIDEVGSQTNETNFFSAEFNMDVGFGDGSITNIFGWRKSSGGSVSDIDAQPVWLFHAPAELEGEQYSNELRYNGQFADKANVTTGVYYYTNELSYHERRNLVGIATGGVAAGAVFDGGGDYDVETAGVFAAVDYDVSEALTLTAGLRYSRETKEAKVASLSANINQPCNIIDGTCPFDFEDEETWDSWSPKLGFTYHLSDDARMYAHWTRGFRSGGYNLRNTSFNPADTPGPFDQETVDSYEIGFKSEFGLARLNAAMFYNQIEDMQREINLPSQGAGVVQLIRNTADADIFGLEVDGTVALTDTLLLIASVGYIDPEYKEVSFDLNTDGVVNSADKDLDLPRAAQWTYSVALNHDLDLGDWGYLSSRISYAHRDESAYTDNNKGWILEQDIIDIGFDIHSNDEKWVVGVYGRNLLDEVKHGGDTQLPADIAGVPTGGTFSPLSKGRVLGVEATYNFF